MKPVFEILIGIAALVVFIILYDVFARKKSVKDSVRSRLTNLFSNSVLYRILSLAVSALILYLLYTLFFK